MSQTSIVGRLLEEISWEKAVKYRQGGRGFENVLTAEVLMGLNFLPRDHFLGALIRCAHGADNARLALADEAESAELSFLPGNIKINSAREDNDKLVVQPDAIITSPSVQVLVEAKRIRTSSFQPEQLAREYVALMTGAEAVGRQPLLWLLGIEPPVLVQGSGRMTIENAVRLHLNAVLTRVGDVGFSEQNLIERIPDVISWTSWDEITECVTTQAEGFRSSDASVILSIKRLTDEILNAVRWHA